MTFAFERLSQSALDCYLSGEGSQSPLKFKAANLLGLVYPEFPSHTFPGTRYCSCLSHRGVITMLYGYRTGVFKGAGRDSVGGGNRLRQVYSRFPLLREIHEGADYGGSGVVDRVARPIGVHQSYGF